MSEGAGAGATYLCDLPLVALVRARTVVRQRLRAGELVVRGGRGDDVALAGDLAGEARDGAGDCVQLARFSQVLPFVGGSIL